MGSSPSGVKPNTLKLTFAASQLSMQNSEIRAKMDWLGIKIMYCGGVIYLCADFYFCDLALGKSN